MAEENSAGYYAKREQQERALAAAAIDPCIRSVHNEMAERYAQLAVAAGEPRAKLRIVQDA